MPLRCRGTYHIRTCNASASCLPNGKPPHKLIMSLLATRALHVCRMANASHCVSNASCRSYPALHVCRMANLPINLSCPYSQRERFTFAARQKASHCEAMLHAGVILRFTVCRMANLPINLSCPYSQRERFTFAARQKASHCVSNASRRIYILLFTLICPQQINTAHPFPRKAEFFAAPLSRHLSHPNLQRERFMFAEWQTSP